MTRDPARRGDDVDVALVAMPFAPVRTPSIGLGIVHRALLDRGLATRTFHAHIDFLEHVGVREHLLLTTLTTKSAVADWLFAPVAFPDFRPDIDPYLRAVWEREPSLRREPYADARARLLALREGVPAFVEARVDELLATGARIIGCGSSFQQHVASLALLRRLRELAPGVVTLLGGPNCDTVMGRTAHRSFAWVDYVVCGEADLIVGDLAERILERGRDLDADALAEGVLGPVHRASGYPRSAGPDDGVRATADDLRAAPFPDYDDYFARLARSPLGDLIQPALSFEFSRGCWWGQRHACRFCGLNLTGLRYRSRPPEAIADALERLVARHEVDRVALVDNALDLRFVRTLAPRLAARPRRLNIFVELRATLPKDHLRALVDAGMTWLQPGIESFSPEALALMNKGCSAAQNIAFLKWSRQLGANVGYNILHGLPGEDDAWYAEMATLLPKLAHLQHAAAIPIQLCRYSDYFNHPARYGVELAPSELYAHVYPLAEADLRDLVYYFDDVAARPRDGLARPGLAALERALADWRAAWAGDAPPTLTMTPEGDGARIFDTRPAAGAPATSYTIAALERQLLERCDAPLREEKLYSEAPAEAPRIAEALASLRWRGLLVAIDGQLIALVLTEPVPSLPKASSHATGAFLPAMFLRSAEPS